MKVYTGSAGGRWWSSSDEFRWLYAPGKVPCLLCLRLLLDDPLLECLEPERWELPPPDGAGLFVPMRPASRRSRAGVALPKNVENRDLPGVNVWPSARLVPASTATAARWRKRNKGKGKTVYKMASSDRWLGRGLGRV